MFNLDVDECQKTDLCKHNGTCINSNGSYVCDCADGWQGQHCEEGKTVLKNNSYIMLMQRKWDWMEKIHISVYLP